MKNNSCTISGATNESPRPPNLIVLYTRITATTPFYSTQAMVEPTSVSQNNRTSYISSLATIIHLQCTWKMMHTTLLGRMPGPRRPIHVRLCIKKNQNAPIIPSEHPPVRRKNVTFRWDQRLAANTKIKTRTAPIPSEHPPVRGKKMSKRLGGNVGCCCAIVKEGALVSPKGSHWTGPEKYRSTVCQSGPSKRAH